MTTGPDLRIEFIERTIALDTTQSMTFGRAGDLVIDDANDRLHRQLGALSFSDGQWWLRNIGRSIPIRMWTTDQNARAVVMSGSAMPLAAAATVIEFEAGRSHYELTLHLTEPRLDRVDRPREPTGLDTICGPDVSLTLSQLQLIVSLAEPALLNPGRAVSVPPSKEAAARLGWTMTKFNSKLKNVCEKYSQMGVRGLGADPGGVVMDRRLRLVEYCIFNKVVSTDDLPVLDADSD